MANQWSDSAATRSPGRVPWPGQQDRAHAHAAPRQALGQVAEHERAVGEAVDQQQAGPGAVAAGGRGALERQAPLHLLRAREARDRDLVRREVRARVGDVLRERAPGVRAQQRARRAVALGVRGRHRGGAQQGGEQPGAPAHGPRHRRDSRVARAPGRGPPWGRTRAAAGDDLVISLYYFRIC
ncbi:MAG: hypothetical protein U5K43_13110 [Halofilum sp. (in: g-proteobacteria)]|nr:hypothetical protein [Halofilum sp. (in: g-proteobacteria)]